MTMPELPAQNSTNWYGYMQGLDSQARAALPAASAYTDEQARDAIAAALVAGSNVTITPNDGANTITIAATGGGSGSAVTIAPETYGAVGNGSTDDTTAIANALTAAAAATVTGNGAVVELGAKTYLTGPLTIPHSVTLRGQGRGSTRLLLKASSTAACVAFGTHTAIASVEDLRIDGNKFNQTSSAAHGVHLQAQGTFNSSLDEYNDVRNMVRGVHVENTKGDGIRFEGRGACLITNVWTWLCDGYGIKASGNDSYVVNADVAGSGLDGIYVDGADLSFLNCKVWYSGQVSTASGGGNGWYISTFGGFRGSGLGSQDNARAGFFFNSCGRIVANSIMADSNNTANLSAPGVDLNQCYFALINGYSWDRNVNTNRQAYALRVTGGSTNNHVSLLGDQHGTGFLDPSSTLVGTSVTNVVFDGLNTKWLTPLRPPTSTTAARPAASAAGIGAAIYDTTLSKPVWSNGTVWKDAAGTTV